MNLLSELREQSRTRFGPRLLIVLVPLVIALVGSILFLIRSEDAQSVEPIGNTCALGARCEAEDALLTGTWTEAFGPGQWAGSSGTSYVVGLEHPGTSIGWTVSGVSNSGTHLLDIRFSNYRGNDDRLGQRTLTLSVNQDSRQIQFPTTQSWRAWSDLLVSNIDLIKGDNVIKLEFGDHDTGRVDIDFIRAY